MNYCSGEESGDTFFSSNIFASYGKGLHSAWCPCSSVQTQHSILSSERCSAQLPLFVLCTALHCTAEFHYLGD